MSVIPYPSLGNTTGSPIPVGPHLQPVWAGGEGLALLTDPAPMGACITSCLPHRDGLVDVLHRIVQLTQEDDCVSTTCPKHPSCPVLSFQATSIPGAPSMSAGLHPAWGGSVDPSPPPPSEHVAFLFLHPKQMLRWGSESFCLESGRVWKQESPCLSEGAEEMHGDLAVIQLPTTTSFLLPARHLSSILSAS